MQNEEKNPEMKGLPENAFRELKKDEKYVPVLRPDKNYPEVTPYSVSLGLVMAVIFNSHCNNRRGLVERHEAQ